MANSFDIPAVFVPAWGNADTEQTRSTARIILFFMCDIYLPKVIINIRNQNGHSLILTIAKWVNFNFLSVDFQKRLKLLHQSFISKTKIALVTHDNMIDHLNIKKTCSLTYFISQFFIRFTRLQIARRMIMA